MAVFNMAVKKRPKNSYGSYHEKVEAINSRLNGRKGSAKLGFLRTIFTALSLLLGAFMFYVAMHYLPALINPKTIFGGFSNGGPTIKKQYNGPASKVLKPYLDMFSLQRTYILGHQEILARYELPKNSVLELQIKRCQRVFIVEVFQCRVISESTDTIKITGKTKGIKGYQFSEKGFYHFSNKVTLPEGNTAPYSMVWARK